MTENPIDRNTTTEKWFYLFQYYTVFWKFVYVYLFLVLVHCIRIRKTIPEQDAWSQTNPMFVEVYAKCITSIQHIKTWILNCNTP